MVQIRGEKRQPKLIPEYDRRSSAFVSWFSRWRTRTRGLSGWQLYSTTRGYGTAIGIPKADNSGILTAEKNHHPHMVSTYMECGPSLRHPPRIESHRTYWERRRLTWQEWIWTIVGCPSIKNSSQRDNDRHTTLGWCSIGLLGGPICICCMSYSVLETSRGNIVPCRLGSFMYYIWWYSANMKYP